MAAGHSGTESDHQNFQSKIQLRTLSMSIKHECILHPITALEFFQKIDDRLLILAGEGRFLKIFDARSSEFLSQCEIFQDQTIHGLSIRESTCQNDELELVIWGGSSVILLRRHQFKHILNQKVSKLFEFVTVTSDWILDASISPHDGSCVLVTAHNTVFLAKLDCNSDSVTLEELHSPSRSILYSAHLIWESFDQVLVAAGTVFGEIVTWQCSVSGDTSSSIGKVLFTFTGHEGSVFGVNISPIITQADGSSCRFLASCSDDRTIRLWDLSANSATKEPRHDLVSARETGFGYNGSQKDYDRCLAVAMGHASRIWRVQFLVDKRNSVNVISFGEDSTAQKWVLNFPAITHKAGDSDNKAFQHSTPQKKLGHLYLENTFAFHNGKHIWSAATKGLDETQALLATGGADGKISTYKVRVSDRAAPNSPLLGADLQPNEPNPSDSWNLEEIFKIITLDASETDHVAVLSPEVEQNRSSISVDGRVVQKKKPKKIMKDSFNQYAFFSENEIIAITNYGRVLTGTIDASLQWKEVLLPKQCKDDFKSYAIVEGFPELGMAFLACANGKIYTYKEEKILEVMKIDEKVADMFKIPNPGTKTYELLVTTLGGRFAILFKTSELISNYSALPAEQYQIGLAEKFIVTSAGRAGSIIILGSRSGTLAVYDPTRPEKPLCLFDEDVFGDAITSIVSLPTMPAPVDSHTETFFLITSRKGIFSIFSCSLRCGDTGIMIEARLRPIHHSTPPFGSMIESAWFSASNQDLMLYGFKSKNFVVWNETSQTEIMSVECGGAHRSYSYSPAGHFIYTKASRLNLYSQKGASHRTVKSGGHGREIKACAVSSNKSLIATGSEDTTIRVWKYKPHVKDNLLENEFCCQTIVRKHTAGIQHLQFLGSNYLFSSGGNEEFFIWAINSIPGMGIGVVCEAKIPDQSEERDLRIMSFDVSEFSSSMLISLAYSDSTIRIYTYSKTQKFRLVSKGRYKSSCLMQIRHLNQSPQRGDETILHLLTAATDGKLTVWKSSISTHESAELERVQSTKVHQSSIKSLDMSTISSSNELRVVTGGDDNALCMITFSSNDFTRPPRVLVLRNAHAAAVTGLCVVENERKKALSVVTSGNDQRVKEWIFSITPEREAELVKTGDMFTCVADIGDVVALRDQFEGGTGKVLVVGNGMEVWTAGKVQH